MRTPAPYLEESLDSVLTQEPAPDVVIVVDDRSEPPVALAERHRERCRQARFGGPGGGPEVARQIGAHDLAGASLDLIALADADDVWEPGKLAAQLAALEAHPEAAVCFGRAEVIGEDGRPTGELLPELPKGELTAAQLLPILFERNPIPAASAVIRKSALDAVGGFMGSGTPERLEAGSDWELWLRLVAARHSFVCEPRARIRYRRHASGLSSDLVRLARAGLAIHDAHGDLVDADTRRRVRAGDLTSLARALIRERGWSEARAALAEAAELEPPGARERLLRGVVAVPGVRAALGRRDPYRSGAP